MRVGGSALGGWRERRVGAERERLAKAALSPRKDRQGQANQGCHFRLFSDLRFFLARLVETRKSGEIPPTGFLVSRGGPINSSSHPKPAAGQYHLKGLGMTSSLVDPSPEATLRLDESRHVRLGVALVVRHCETRCRRR
ncbi:hypothetical protein HPB47_008310 [Ixodes persulcatus]|uniref:Uncharacterized protein n=1 Tax=Ixodes persulcatus TaxID=34615 RepID=A0AC60P531_IXOPE|nr:hypothetical protein HPB47_008310 [Ixodes persulcatus]